MQKCACCGNYSLNDDSLFEVCDICGWQQDLVAENDPNYTGGANNDLSLYEARAIWSKNHCPIRNKLFHKENNAQDKN